MVVNGDECVMMKSLSPVRVGVAGNWTVQSSQPATRLSRLAQRFASVQSRATCGALPIRQPAGALQTLLRPGNGVPSAGATAPQWAAVVHDRRGNARHMSSTGRHGINVATPHAAAATESSTGDERRARDRVERGGGGRGGSSGLEFDVNRDARQSLANKVRAVCMARASTEPPSPFLALPHRFPFTSSVFFHNWFRIFGTLVLMMTRNTANLLALTIARPTGDGLDEPEWYGRQ